MTLDVRIYIPRVRQYQDPINAVPCPRDRHHSCRHPPPATDPNQFVRWDIDRLSEGLIAALRLGLLRISSAYPDVTPARMPVNLGAYPPCFSSAAWPKVFELGLPFCDHVDFEWRLKPMPLAEDKSRSDTRTGRPASVPGSVRTLGIIGGLGPESTIDYYRSILARFRARKPDGGYPQVIINSLDVDKGIAMLDAGRLDDLADYLASGVEMLTRAGAEFACIAANTPHLVFDEVQRRSPIPLISIVRATADYAKARGLKRVGLFGTGFTMKASFYPDEFQRAGIVMVRPKETEREFIHRKYIYELLNNKFLPETRTEILSIGQRMMDEEGIQALVLAGTELPLLLRGSQTPRLEFLDTTAIHVEAIVNDLLGFVP